MNKDRITFMKPQFRMLITDAVIFMTMVGHHFEVNLKYWQNLSVYNVIILIFYL